MKTKTTSLFLIIFIFLNNVHPQGWETVNCNWADLNFPGGFAYSMYYDKPNNAIYVGCFGDLYSLNLNTLAWTWVDADPDSGILANAKIISVCKDKTGCIYAGCNENTPSYYSVDGGKKWRQIMDFSFSINSVFCIAEAPDGSIWFGTNRGLIVSYDHGKTFTVLSNMKKSISEISISSNGTIYAGTNGGLFKSTNGGKDWTQANFQFPGSSVFAIGINAKGYLFVGTSTYLYLSADNGISWESLSPTGESGGPGVTKDIAFDTEGNLIVNAILLMISYDYGHYFYQINCSISNPNPTSIQPKGVVIDKDNRIFITNTNKAPYLFMGQIIPTSVESQRLEVPLNFGLSQNYPNPFNPSTTIKFSIPPVGTFHQPRQDRVLTGGTSLQHVVLKVYDLLGREVGILVNEEKTPGNYEIKFDIETFHGTSLPSGVYFYNLTNGNNSITKKMLLMK